MPLPHIKWTVRQMLIVVAMAAVLLGIGRGALQLKRRWDCCQTYAQAMTIYERLAREIEGSDSAWNLWLFGLVEELEEFEDLDAEEASRKHAARWAAKADHYAKRRREYERAAVRPWLPIPPLPDPPLDPSAAQAIGSPP